MGQQAGVKREGRGCWAHMDVTLGDRRPFVAARTDFREGQAVAKRKDGDGGTPPADGWGPPTGRHAGRLSLASPFLRRRGRLGKAPNPRTLSFGLHKSSNPHSKRPHKKIIHKFQIVAHKIFNAGNPSL